MEQTQKRRAERTTEPPTDDTQTVEPAESNAVDEADRLLEEIYELLETIEEQNGEARSLIDLIEEEDDEADSEETDEQALWNLGLYAPSDLPSWLRNELGGNPCPYCGCDPCRGIAAWLADGAEF